LFEVYLPMFYETLKYYSDFIETNAMTQKEKELLAESVKKFYNYLHTSKFESNIDVESSKIQFNAVANTFINELDKRI